MREERGKDQRKEAMKTMWGSLIMKARIRI